MAPPGKINASVSADSSCPTDDELGRLIEGRGDLSIHATLLTFAQ